MKQIHIKTGYLALLMCLTLASCKKLDQTPPTSLTDDSFWKTPADLTGAANYFYTFLPGLGAGSPDDPTGAPTPQQDNYSDHAFGTGSVGIGDGTRVAPATSNEWINFYKLIRACNNLIEKAPSITATSASDIATVKYAVGEAKFFRAWGYFELLKRFGDVPYINRTLSTTDDALYTPRTNRQIVVDSIYADLDLATAILQSPEASGFQYGRISRTAALAFKSRVALFQGTWDKFRGDAANAAKHLQIAVTASNAVIAGGKHSLYTGSGADSYYYEFQYSGGLAGNPVTVAPGPQVNYNYGSNRENIMVRLYGANNANRIITHNYARATLEANVITATRSFMDSYLYKDGLPIGKSIYDTSASPTSTLTEYNNRDPRIGMTVWNKTMQYVLNGGVNNHLPGTAYRIRKYWVVSDWNLQAAMVNFNVIRYAEVLLNYAEAKYELNNGVLSDADIDLTINALRNRATNNDPAKLALLTNAFVTANGLNLQTEIRRERSIELAFEGFRYWDLLRWKLAETVLPNAVLAGKYFPGETSGSAPSTLNPQGYNVLQPAASRKFTINRDYLWPIPTKEIALGNGKISQNLNW